MPIVLLVSPIAAMVNAKAVLAKVIQTAPVGKHAREAVVAAVPVVPKILIAPMVRNAIMAPAKAAPPLPVTNVHP